MNDNSAELADIKKAFQNYYDKKRGSLSSGAMASISKQINPVALKNANKDEPVEATPIEEVVINVKRPLTPPDDSWVPKYNDSGSGGGGSGAGSGMSGGSGTYGGGSGPAPHANQKIINNLKNYPCAQKLLEQLPNLNNSLAKLLNDALATNGKIDVTFEGGILKGDKPGEIVAGRTKYIETNKITGVISYRVILNQDILGSATQEYVLAVMYHEAIHAFLGYQFRTLGADAYHAKYPYLESYVVGGETKFKFIIGDHQAYTPFVNMIADAIQSYNPKFPRDRAISLAMEGITDDELPNNGDSYNTIERHSGDKAAGTKCAKP
ncbi:hypothetical protein [Elizabethkingia meningoseptica]|uniref:hypothetical protein n=1 Tax=Elizabethkingia meningoseptica TaxID=238 RepID=UPI003891F2DA